METSNQPVSPLRQRMLEDMRMRKLAPKTREAYIRAVSRFAKYLGRSPDTATAEDLRRYQLHLVDSGTSPITLNATITGLKFLFDVTLGHGDVLAKMQSVRVPHKIPVVLNKQEVARLIACAGNLKHQTALSLAYGTGLRANEVISLRVTDIDSQRMTLRVEQGKGGRDRYAMISPVLLERLRMPMQHPMSRCGRTLCARAAARKCSLWNRFCVVRRFVRHLERGVNHDHALVHSTEQTTDKAMRHVSWDGLVC